MAGQPQPPPWLLLAIALITGGGGGAAVMRLNDPRPDPFTGTQAAQMEARLQAAIAAQATRIEVAEEKDANHRMSPWHDAAGVQITRTSLRMQRNEDALVHIGARLDSVVKLLERIQAKLDELEDAR
jgi:hypothetical protein